MAQLLSHTFLVSNSIECDSVKQQNVLIDRFLEFCRNSSMNLIICPHKML